MDPSTHPDSSSEVGVTGAFRPRRWPIAVLLGVLTPGLGQVYNGQWRKGIGFFAGQWLAGVAALATVPSGPGAAALTGLVALGVWVASVIEAAAAARAQVAYTLRPFNRWFVYLGVICLLVIVDGAFKGRIRAGYVQAFRIPAQSMAPAVLSGDFLFVDKRATARSPRRGDVVLFAIPPRPDQKFVKRVVAIGGDLVELRDKRLYVNGREVPEPFVVHADPQTRPAGADVRDNLGPVRIPRGSVFVLGDNRDDSNDSRYFGPVGLDLVEGRALWIYFSWDPERSGVRWDRIGRRVR